MSGETKAHYAKAWSLNFAKAFIPSGAKQVSKVFINYDFRKISTEWDTLIASQLSNKKLILDYLL